MYSTAPTTIFRKISLTKQLSIKNSVRFFFCVIAISFKIDENSSHICTSLANIISKSISNDYWVSTQNLPYIIAFRWRIQSNCNLKWLIESHFQFNKEASIGSHTMLCVCVEIYLLGSRTCILVRVWPIDVTLYIPGRIYIRRFQFWNGI